MTHKKRRTAKIDKIKPAPQDNGPDYDGKCETCGASPIVRETGLCGPCTFGEADTIDGDW